MTLQEKIEVLDGVKDHPNKEKLVFKIDGEWVPYDVLQFRTLTGMGMKNFIEQPLQERTTYMYADKESIDLLNKMLK